MRRKLGEDVTSEEIKKTPLHLLFHHHLLAIYDVKTRC